MSLPCAEIEKKLGYAFKNQTLLQEAFTHSTYANAYKVNSNERMEFLGDTVLQLIVTEWLYESDKTAREGKLTRERQAFVCQSALDSAVDALGIFPYLLVVGTSRNIEGKAKSSLFEAVTAAIYLDGGYEAAKAFVLSYGNLQKNAQTENWIGALKEFLEKRGEGEAQFRYEKTGSDHAPWFKGTLRAMGEEADGEGKSIKAAKSMAANRLLWELENKSKKK